MTSMKPKRKKDLGREWARKYRAACVAMEKQLDRTFEQIFSGQEWDRDLVSTNAYLMAMHDTMAHAVGCVGGQLLKLGGDQEAILERGTICSMNGMQQDFLKTYRRGKRKRPLAKVIPLPVVR